MLHPILLLPFLPLASPLNTLRILDTGIGHRSIPIPRWPTSLRSISTLGQNPSILATYGPPPNNRTAGIIDPIGAADFAYDAGSQSLFLATGQGVVRTSVNGSEARVVWRGGDVVSIGLSSPPTNQNASARNGKIYWGSRRTGLIHRANADGSDMHIFRNVSQGLNKWGYARSYAAGLFIDERAGWVYWSATRGSEGGSLRRVRISGSGEGREEEELLFEGLDMPKKIRVRDGMVYWCEKGRWSDSPTSLNRARLPPPASTNTTSLSPSSGLKLEKEILVHSNNTLIFFEKDFTGEVQTLGITGFAFDKGGENVFFVMESSGRQVFAKMVKVGVKAKDLKLVSEDVGGLGVPMGIEWVG